MSLTGLLKRLRVTFLKRLRPGRDSGNVVFEYRGGTALSVPAYRKLTAVTAANFACWRRGEEIAKAIGLQVDQGADCFAVLDPADQVQCFLLTKAGDRLEQWFFELSEREVVIFSVNTHVSRRGERLAGRLSAAVADMLTGQGRRVLLDCKTWNVSARRAFLAAGFAPVRDEPFPALPRTVATAAADTTSGASSP